MVSLSVATLRDPDGHLRGWVCVAQDITDRRRAERALRTSERKAIRESRLRVRTGRAGESVDAIAKRTNSTWEGKQVAVANGLADDATLRSGQRIKLAIPQPYTPRD